MGALQALAGGAARQPANVTPPATMHFKDERCCRLWMRTLHRRTHQGAVCAYSTAQNSTNASPYRIPSGNLRHLLRRDSDFTSQSPWSKLGGNDHAESSGIKRHKATHPALNRIESDAAWIDAGEWLERVDPSSRGVPVIRCQKTSEDRNSLGDCTRHCVCVPGSAHSTHLDIFSKAGRLSSASEDTIRESEVLGAE